jgi:hypothetical protein
MITYGRVEDNATKQRVGARFAKEVDFLESIGFHKLCIAIEMFPPYSLIMWFPIYLVMAAYRHPSFITSPLRFGAYTPIMVCYETGCFAAVLPNGIKYYARFTDGTILISANFPVQKVNDTRRKFFKYSDQYLTMERVHQLHQARIKDYLKQDKVLDRDLRYEIAVEMSQLEDSYTYGTSHSLN